MWFYLNMGFFQFSQKTTFCFRPAVEIALMVLSSWLMRWKEWSLIVWIAYDEEYDSSKSHPWMKIGKLMLIIIGIISSAFKKSSSLYYLMTANLNKYLWNELEHFISVKQYEPVTRPWTTNQPPVDIDRHSNLLVTFSIGRKFQRIPHHKIPLPLFRTTLSKS